MFSRQIYFPRYDLALSVLVRHLLQFIGCMPMGGGEGRPGGRRPVRLETSCRKAGMKNISANLGAAKGGRAASTPHGPNQPPPLLN